MTAVVEADLSDLVAQVKLLKDRVGVLEVTISEMLKVVDRTEKRVIRQVPLTTKEKAERAHGGKK